MSESTYGRLRDRVMLQRLGDAIVVLNAGTGQYYELNQSGADMLELWLEHGGDVERVVATLTRRYAAPAAEISADLAALLGELDAAGLIETPTAP